MPSLACAAASALRADTRQAPRCHPCARLCLPALHACPLGPRIPCCCSAYPRALLCCPALLFPPSAAWTCRPRFTPSTPAVTWPPPRPPSRTGLRACAAGRGARAARPARLSWRRRCSTTRSTCTAATAAGSSTSQVGGWVGGCWGYLGVAGVAVDRGGGREGKRGSKGEAGKRLQLGV